MKVEQHGDGDCAAKREPRWNFCPLLKRERGRG